MRYLLIAFIFFGCCSKDVVTKTETVVRNDTIFVPIYADTDFSPIILDQHGFGEDDKVKVRVDTVYKVDKVYVQRKADTVKVVIRDTVIVRTEITKPEEKESFFDLTLKETLLIMLGMVTLASLGRIFVK